MMEKMDAKIGDNSNVTEQERAVLAKRSCRVSSLRPRPWREDCQHE
jgi:hypothetical protein